MEPHNRCYRVLLADAYAEAGLEDEAAKLLDQAGELGSYELEFIGRRRLELNKAELDASRRLMNLLALSLGPLGTNCYLVWDKAPGPALLVDCAGTADEILQAAEARGLRLSTIVLTHGHMDHIECLAELAARTGAQVAIHTA